MAHLTAVPDPPLCLVDCELCEGDGIMVAVDPYAPLDPPLVVPCPACEGGCRFVALDPYARSVEDVVTVGGVL